MTRNEILNNIKEQFKKMMFADAPKTSTFTTTDGKNLIVMGEDIAVGVEIYQVDDNNVQTPLDNGDYTLTDGRTFTVADNKVSDITAPDPAQQEESPAGGASDASQAKMEMGDGMPDGMPTDPDAAEEPADDTEARLSALEQQIQEILQMLQGTMAQTEKMMNSQVEMSETVRKIAAEPAGEKPKIGKVYVTDKQTTMSASMDDIRQIQKRLTQVKGL